jgi:hypothetical protein
MQGSVYTGFTVLAKFDWYYCSDNTVKSWILKKNEIH